MTPHSADDTTHYIGTTLINGVLHHRWLDGTTLPVISGGAGEDDDDGSDDDGDDDDGSGDDGDDDEDDKSKKKGKGKDDDDDDDEPKNASERRAHRQAAKYRIKARTEGARADAAEARETALKAQVAKLEKDGAGDDALKAKITELETALTEANKVIDAHKAEAKEAAMFAELVSAIEEFDLDCDEDVLHSKLKRNGLLTVDDDGEVEDLGKSVKTLLKRGVLKKKVASGDDDEEGKDDESGAPSSSSGKPMRRGNRNAGNVGNSAKLVKKYPALQR